MSLYAYVHRFSEGATPDDYLFTLQVNFACQYSHTMREKELIKRSHAKQFTVPDQTYGGGKQQPYAGYNL